MQEPMIFAVYLFVCFVLVLAEDLKLMDVGLCKDIDSKVGAEQAEWVKKLLEETNTWAVKFTTIIEEKQMLLSSMTLKVHKDEKTTLKFEWQLAGQKSGAGVNSLLDEVKGAPTKWINAETVEGSAIKYYVLKKGILSVQRNGKTREISYFYIYKCTTDTALAKLDVDARYVVFYTGNVLESEAGEITMFDESAKTEFGFSTPLKFVT